MKSHTSGSQEGKAGIILGIHDPLHSLIKTHPPIKFIQSGYTTCYPFSHLCHFSLAIIWGDFKRFVADPSEI